MGYGCVSSYNRLKFLHFWRQTNKNYRSRRLVHKFLLRDLESRIPEFLDFMIEDFLIQFGHFHNAVEISDFLKATFLLHPM